MAENIATELEKSVSYSEIYTYMKCPRKHYLSYIERLHKQTLGSSKRMNLGSIVHELLEGALWLYYDKGYEIPLEDVYKHIDFVADEYSLTNRPKPEIFDDGETVFTIGEADAVSWDEDFELAKKIAARTIKHLDIPNKWRIETIDYEGETIPIIEWKFQYPLFGDRNLVGVIDVVMRSLNDDQIYLIDWKTRATLLDDFEIGAEHMSMQLSLYQHVLNSLGVNVAGTITYQIKSSLPTKPYLTEKTRRVARTKGAYDEQEYLTFVVDNGEDPLDFADIHFSSESDWFRPIKIIRSMVELLNRWTNAQQIVQRMVTDDVAPKYETPDCVYCPFFKLCLGEDIGLDNEWYIESQYTKGE